MADINFGSIGVNNGRITGGGINSGLNSTAIIDALLEAQSVRITEIEDQVTFNNSFSTEVTTLQTYLDTLRTKADALRNKPGVNNDASNAFSYRSATVSSTSSSETFVSVLANPGASVSTRSITNVILAQTHTLSYAGFSSNTGSAVSTASLVDDFSVSTSAVETTLDTDSPVTFSNEVTSAGTAAEIKLIFSSDNEFDATDSLSFGSTNLTFGGGGGDDLTLGGTLEDNLITIVNHLNAKTIGAESDYTFTVEDSGGGVDTIVATRNVNGVVSLSSGNLSISSDFSNGSTNQTVSIGSVPATNLASVGDVAVDGTNGTEDTLDTDANTFKTTTLSGAITLGTTPTLNLGSAIGTTSFNPNTVTFTATVGGQTYTSRPVTLVDGSVDGDGDTNGDNGNGPSNNGFGNRIPAGTVITFEKDSASSAPKTDISFNLVVGGSDITIDSQGDANSFASDINTHLTNDSVSITQDSVEPLRAGTFSLGGQSITLESGDNLVNVAAKINAVKSLSGVQAEILKISDSSYTLVLKATESGTDNEISDFTLGTPPNGTIQIGADDETVEQTVAAVDASFDLDGVTITRSTNVIDDVVDDVVFTLLKATSTETTTVDIAEDDSVAQSSILEFLNAYNDLKIYLAQQVQKDAAGNFLETAILGDDSIINDILIPLNAELNRSVEGITTGVNVPNTIFNLGIGYANFAGDSETPPVSNIFELEIDELESLLQSNFDDVRRVFEFELVANDSSLSIFSRTNDFALTDFKLDIDSTRADGQEVRVLDSSDNFLFYADLNLANGSITGLDGTALEGTKFVYTGGAGSKTITVSATQGIGDRVYNVLNSFLTEETGLLDLKRDEISDENTRLDNRLTDLEEALEGERDRLTEIYAAAEAAIGRYNSILGFLDAQLASFNS